MKTDYQRELGRRVLHADWNTFSETGRRSNQLVVPNGLRQVNSVNHESAFNGHL